MRLLLDRLPSPVGPLLLVSDGTALLALDFHDYDDRLHRLLRAHHGPYDLVPDRIDTAVRHALEAYFEGEFGAFAAIPVRTGGTAFQQTVWAALQRIPVGTTTSYGALAARIGKPAATRAVGLANGRNPLAIVVPCHRVIGADGRLTGFGGGLHRKAWLLAHEKAAGAVNDLPGLMG